VSSDENRDSSAELAPQRIYAGGHRHAGRCRRPSRLGLITRPERIPFAPYLAQQVWCVPSVMLSHDKLHSRSPS
jgi:hypothetical protein